MPGGVSLFSGEWREAGSIDEDRLSTVFPKESGDLRQWRSLLELPSGRRNIVEGARQSTGNVEALPSQKPGSSPDFYLARL
jgi:hypothetical protein